MTEKKQTQKKSALARRPRVLIVEDDIPTLDALMFKLESMGIPSVGAKDGEEATTMIRAQQWDVIVIDILLPKKNGFAILEEIRGQPEFAHTAIFAFSNLSGAEYMQRALNAGAHEFIEKTKVSLDDIAGKIASALAKQHS